MPTSDEIKTYGFYLTIAVLLLKGLQWLFTNKAQVDVLRAQLASIEEKIDAISEALKAGEARMQYLEREHGHFLERLGKAGA